MKIIKISALSETNSMLLKIDTEIPPLPPPFSSSIPDGKTIVQNGELETHEIDDGVSKICY